MRKLVMGIVLLTVLLSTCSCALFKNKFDAKTGFSDQLKQTEDYIRTEDWVNAKNSLENLKKIWKKLKPMLQVDIDHDYVNSIESDFIRLGAYIETNNKSDSLATILLIQDTWENIGSL